MKALILYGSLVLFFILALPLWNYIQRKRGVTERLEEIESDPVDGTCCGQHATCEKDSLINSFVEKVDYFDDEELDVFKGRDANSYQENEVEEFRDVFHSMLDSDKARWVRSLQMRGVEIPAQMRDEILLVINDIRAKKMA